MTFNRFPAGPYAPPQSIDRSSVTRWADALANFPVQLSAVTAGASEKDLLTLTAPGVWTVAQVIHHIADSHMNSFVRMKVALTEENPTIKPYDESSWSRTADATSPDARSSLAIIEGVHTRMARLLRSLDEKQILRTDFHPEGQRTYSIGEAAALYV